MRVLFRLVASLGPRREDRDERRVKDAAGPIVRFLFQDYLADLDNVTRVFPRRDWSPSPSRHPAASKGVTIADPSPGPSDGTGARAAPREVTDRGDAYAMRGQMQPVERP